MGLWLMFVCFSIHVCACVVWWLLVYASMHIYTVWMCLFNLFFWLCWCYSVHMNVCTSLSSLFTSYVVCLCVCAWVRAWVCVCFSHFLPYLHTELYPSYCIFFCGSSTSTAQLIDVCNSSAFPPFINRAMNLTFPSIRLNPQSYGGS